MAAWFGSGGAILDTGGQEGQKAMKQPAAAITGAGKTPRKGAAALVAEGDAVDDDKPGDKAVKTPIEEARSKASKMAQTMAASSAKLQATAATTKKDTLTAPLLGSITETRKSLESKRVNLLQLACSPRSTVGELRSATVLAAKVVADSTDLGKLAKPFSAIKKASKKAKAE